MFEDTLEPGELGLASWKYLLIFYDLKAFAGMSSTISLAKLMPFDSNGGLIAARAHDTAEEPKIERDGALQQHRPLYSHFQIRINRQFARCIEANTAAAKVDR